MYLNDSPVAANLLLGLLCALAVPMIIVASLRLSAINRRRTCGRIVVGSSLKFGGWLLVAFACIDWFYSQPVPMLFRWFLLSGGLCIAAADLLLSLRWLRGKARRQAHAKGHRHDHAR